MRRRPRAVAGLLFALTIVAVVLAVLVAALELAGGPGPQHRVTTTTGGGR
jgi:hypothetical protein